MLLDGKAVAITGAGRGLGRAYALLSAAHGARVVVNDVDEEFAEAVVDEIKSSGGEAVVSTDTVSTWDGAKSIIDTCLTTFGALDGLVNNAGLFHERRALDEEESGIRSLVEVNLLGSIFCGLHALRAMAAQRRGSVVNIVSGAALGTEGQSTYGATKGGMVAITYAWASESYDAGIRVNGLSPIAWTRLAAKVTTARPGLEPQHTDPAEIAPLAVYLLSDESCHVTGQIIRLDETGLCVLKPSEYSKPAEPEERTPEAVRHAFSNEVNDILQPVGKARRELAGRQVSTEARSHRN